MKNQLEMSKLFAYALTGLVGTLLLTIVGSALIAITFLLLASVFVREYQAAPIFALPLVWGLMGIVWAIGSVIIATPTIFTWSWTLKKSADSRAKALKKSILIVFSLGMALPSLGISTALLGRILGGF
jgi:hypothetical protein